jgi:protein disulfide-isomerase
MIKNKPPDEELVRQKDLTACITYGKKHFISGVMIINKGRGEREMAAKDDLVHNQQFVRYMNHNVSYTEIEWPYDSDTSAEALAFRNFAAIQNIEPVPLQLIVWDMQTNKVNFRLKAIDPQRADQIVAMIEQHLPKIDYNAGWIEDYRLATAIAQQQKRYILIAFTAMDSSEFSRKAFEEIFETDEFKKYARKHLVTVKIDFPTKATQPAGLISQNKTLAETYAVRGFPYMILLNPLAQKIGNAKYMKGGPEVFLKPLQASVKNDEDRRAFLAGEPKPE